MLLMCYLQGPRKNKSIIIEVKEFLHQQFTKKDMGYAKFFLGLEIARSEQGIYLNQRKYIMDIINDAGL